MFLCFKLPQKPGSEMGIQPQQVPNWGHFSVSLKRFCRFSGGNGTYLRMIHFPFRSDPSLLILPWAFRESMMNLAPSGVIPRLFAISALVIDGFSLRSDRVLSELPISFWVVF